VTPSSGATAFRWLFPVSFLALGAVAFLSKGPAGNGSAFVFYCASMCVAAFSTRARPHARLLLIAGYQLLILSSMRVVTSGRYQVPLGILLWVLFTVSLTLLLDVPIMPRRDPRAGGEQGRVADPSAARVAAAVAFAVLMGLSALVAALLVAESAIRQEGRLPPNWDGGLLAACAVAASSFGAAAMTFPMFLSSRNRLTGAGRFMLLLIAFSATSLTAELYFGKNWSLCVLSLIALLGSFWVSWLVWKCRATTGAD
jgi:hypothetical protein